MPEIIEPTEFSGISFDPKEGFFSIGVEAFFHKAGHLIANYTNDKMVLVDGPARKIEMHAISAAMRPPTPEYGLWKTKQWKTEGLFRVIPVLESGKEYSIPIVNIILKTTYEPQQLNQGPYLWPFAGHKIIGFRVELQVAGSGGNQGNPSNMELQAVGRLL
jgi:hypothetical protein